MRFLPPALALLLCSTVITAEDKVWIGAFIYGDNDKKPSYWMGQMAAPQLQGILEGTTTAKFFTLENVHWWNSQKIQDNTRWFVVAQKDDDDSGTMHFRLERLDRISVLNGDPTKLDYLEDANGNRIKSLKADPAGF
jgi:hypothetical protein